MVGDGLGEPLGQLIHVGERRRVGHQFADGGLQIGLGSLEGDAARGDDAGEDFGEPGALADGERGALGGGIEPIGPGAAKH